MEFIFHANFILMKQIIELVQVAIGVRDDLSRMPSEKEWEALFKEASHQGLIGITYVGVRKLMGLPGCTLPKKLLLRWSGVAVQLKDQNAHVSARGERVLRYFRDAGFQAIILKGQSHLPNYPEELRDLRAPGDIDVWVRGGSKKQVYDLVRKDCPDEDYGYLHIHYPVFSDTSVEIHIRPAYLCNPLRNHRLQQWAESLDLEALGEPNAFRDFNAIYQPLHLFKHLLREGITLRQLLDYYFLLKQEPHTDVATLRQFGLDGFCRDLQSVVFNIFENKPISSESEMRLLEEVKQDITEASLQIEDEWGRLKRVVWMYPGEVLWRPWFWISQKIWKMFY